jgi:isoleucyl-tRNA synthetase
MAPFLSFTAEEAWKIIGKPTSLSIFIEKYWEFAQHNPGFQEYYADRAQALEKKWERILAIRTQANRAIETLREVGQVGSSLQSHIIITASKEDIDILKTVEPELKFIFIVSQVALKQGTHLDIHVEASTNPKCPRCWHYYEPEVTVTGKAKADLEVCPRCRNNLYGTGEVRHFA